MDPTIARLILATLNLILTGVQLAPEAKRRASALKAMLTKIVQENRDPTDEEWAAIDAADDDLEARLRAAGL